MSVCLLLPLLTFICLIILSWNLGGPKDKQINILLSHMKKHILVVDDEREFAEMLSERLELKGFSTAIAYDGFEALSWLEKNSCEIVLLDLGLPGMNGIEVLPVIKKNYPFVQVVILTAASDVNSAIAGMKFGAADYLIKPVAFASLLASIHDAQTRREGHEESLRMIEMSKMAAYGVLAEGVAHEIMNPVNVMLASAGWVEDLLSDMNNLQDEDRIEMVSTLDTIRKHGLRCKDIVAKLLAFGGRIDPTPKPVRINDLLAGLLRKKHERAEELRVEIKEEFASDLPTFFIPPTEFGVAFENIVENCLDAMEKKGGTLRLSTFLEDNFCHIVISDTGIGIAEADLARIFEPFFSTKEVGKGTGLGLSICYRTVRGMGGDIRAESRKGEGTTLFIRLPVPAEKSEEKGTSQEGLARLHYKM